MRGRRAVLLLLLLVCVGACGERSQRRSRKLIVLGMDGMDWQLLQRYLREGRMPNLASLAKRGGMLPLATSTPPESPVAWSDFITGQHSDQHGIYDFVHRDLASMSPFLSTSRVVAPSLVVHLGSLTLPLTAGKTVLLREGPAFWELLGKASVHSTICEIPADYPPRPSRHSELLAGMGAPDLLGTYGVFQLFTTDPAWVSRPLVGGRVFGIGFGADRHAVSSLEGPANPWSSEGKPLLAPFELILDEERRSILVRLGSEERLLKAGEWSDWIPVAFRAPPAGEIRGMVRLLVKSLSPNVTVYVSPINIDPMDPAQPISSPPELASEIARDLGRYHTIGIPEDVKALEAGIFSDEDFLTQADAVLTERTRLLERELSRFHEGLLFVYFGSTDQISHAFWRTLAPEGSHSATPDAIARLYARMDGIVGEVMSRADSDTAIIVMSDHGFSPYRTKVNLNTWLMKRGLLALRPPTEHPAPGLLGHIDWSRTKAYGLGLNLLYLNRRGREREGIVSEDERDGLLQNITEGLEALRDPQTHEPVVSKVSRPQATTHVEISPDLIIGYNRGYRCSDSSALGKVGDTVLEENRDKWSGDHCMDPALVPGILVSSVPLTSGDASLVDLTASILAYFGVPATEGLAGHSIIAAPREPGP